jgi:hypothetical protein
VLWHFLLPAYQFVSQGATKRHNRGSPKHDLFSVILAIHTKINGTNSGPFRFFIDGPWFGGRSSERNN